MLADAIVDVASHYNTVIDPKNLAWFGLISTLITVYGARLGAVALGKKMTRAENNDGDIRPEPAQPMTGGVVQMSASGFPLNLPVVNA